MLKSLRNKIASIDQIKKAEKLAKIFMKENSDGFVDSVAKPLTLPQAQTDANTRDSPQPTEGMFAPVQDEDTQAKEAEAQKTQQNKAKACM